MNNSAFFNFSHSLAFLLRDMDSFLTILIYAINIMDFIILGVIIGLFMSVLSRVFSIKEIVGFTLLSIAGVFYGNYLAIILEDSLNQPLPFLQPLLIIIGALSLTSLKVILLSRGRASKFPHRTMSI